jgi:signal transduction histidine kinase/CheY-like chemotaxis protein
MSPPPTRDRAGDAIGAASLDEGLALVGVLHELTVACLDLFDPRRSLDDFLQTLAARLGSRVVLCVERPAAPARPRLEGAVGLARTSRDLTPSEWLDGSDGPLPYPEIADPTLIRWVVDTRGGEGASGSRWSLVLYFEREPRLPRRYRGMLERLSRSLGAALAHRAFYAQLERRVEERTEELARANRELAQSLATLRDVERRLAVSDRMASLGTLAAGVAHEINGPLAYIRANLDLLIEATSGGAAESPDAIRDMATDARLGTEHVHKIVRGLKAFSRMDDAPRRPIDLLGVIEFSVELTQNELRHRARVVRELGPVPPVDAEEGRLAQVFINILVNAAQALPNGEAAKHQVRIVTRTDLLGRAVVEIADTGPGIPADALDRVFEPFYTTKPVGVGTGLGLAICHGIVTGLGGEIMAESEHGRGTLFRVILPAASGHHRAASQSSRPGNASSSACVLVVDDDPLVARALSRILRQHQVALATSGREALAWLESHPQVDVIFCDLMMPEMTGMELHRVLQERLPSLAVRVVFMTGGAFTPEASGFLEHVLNERIDKPFDVHAVRRIVRKLREVRDAEAASP